MGATHETRTNTGECQVKNGRLAMLAFGGILHQQLLSKTPTLAFEKTKGLTMLDFSKVQPFN